jgi:hypothetical protein
MAFIYAIVNYEKKRYLIYHKDLGLVNCNVWEPDFKGIMARQAF